MHMTRIHYTVLKWLCSPFLLCYGRNEHKSDWRTAKGGRAAGGGY